MDCPRIPDSRIYLSIYISLSKNISLSIHISLSKNAEGSGKVYGSHSEFANDIHTRHVIRK